MSEEIRSSLRIKLETLYRHDDGLLQHQSDYMAALSDLSNHIDKLRVAWDSPRPAGLDDVHACAIQVMQAATRLCAVMERIPKGAVIP